MSALVPGLRAAGSWRIENIFVQGGSGGLLPVAVLQSRLKSAVSI